MGQRCIEIGWVLIFFPSGDSDPKLVVFTVYTVAFQPRSFHAAFIELNWL